MKIEDGQEITHEMATAALRRAVRFFSALQASDGHWPAENAGPLFFLPPLVSPLRLITIIFLNDVCFPYTFFNSEFECRVDICRLCVYISQGILTLCSQKSTGKKFSAIYTAIR